jgi:hypothetical protein
MEHNRKPLLLRYAAFCRHRYWLQLLMLSISLVMILASPIITTEYHWKLGVKLLIGGISGTILWLVPFAISAGTAEPSVIARDILDALHGCKSTGLSRIYVDRKEALVDFWKNHVINADSPPTMLTVWGVSLKGTEVQGMQLVNLLGDFLLLNRNLKRKVDLRLFLTHPQYGRIRARQEHEGLDSIGNDVCTTIKLLKSLIEDPKHPFQSSHIRLYKGMSTAFIVATERWILIQPYPHQWDDSRSALFSLVAEKTQDFGIYAQWMERNINKAWTDMELTESFDLEKDYSDLGAQPVTI